MCEAGNNVEEFVYVKGKCGIIEVWFCICEGLLNLKVFASNLQDGFNIKMEPVKISSLR